MKIKSSTQWSNIYSSASKYNINVKSSRYKLAAYALLIILTVLVGIITFSYYYVLALGIAILSVLSFGLFLSNSPNNRINTSQVNNKQIISSLIVSDTGDIQIFAHCAPAASSPLGNKLHKNSDTSAEKRSDNIFENISAPNLPAKNYQLLATSRFSFIGCWLIMTLKSHDATSDVSAVDKSKYKSDNAKRSPKQLFIFRDSVSEQDFARLARVVKQL